MELTTTSPGVTYPDAPSRIRTSRFLKLRPEYVALTSDTVQALLLEVVMSSKGFIVYEHEVAEKAMFSYPLPTIRRHFKALMKRGFIHDPGRVPQGYRANLLPIKRGVEALGYEQPEYPDPDYTD